MVKTAVHSKTKKITGNLNGLSNGTGDPKQRVDVRKTYKLYIDGKFPRSESGRFIALKNANGETIANICRASRKDVRDSVVSNRKALIGWSSRSAYNKGQILYRIAETLESRKEVFVATMIAQGLSKTAALKETEEAIDLLVYYAGWTDKYIQLFSSVNPVESSHFNFSFPEPTGVVIAFPDEKSPLTAMIAMVAPVIAGGNTCTLIVTGNYPLTAIDFAEVLHASDVPAGVINILTGQQKELLIPAAMHKDVNAITWENLNSDQQKTMQSQATGNLKRVPDFSSEPLRSPYRIMMCQEIKTTWHPVGI
jgi:acyl-CoA reductase-like NAD-dependent aldehyde dehydrogenase